MRAMPWARLRPTALPEHAPPPGLWAFYWHFIRQSRGLYGMLFVTGLAVALIDTVIPLFIGRLVRVMEATDRAAAVLAKLTSAALDHCVAGHVSAEGAHPALLAHLGKDPLLNLGLRLGEGSGAALAIGVLQGAVACHSGMATFGEAGVAAG